MSILSERKGSAFCSSSSRSSDGNSNLLDEGGSASQVPQASSELAGYGSVVWPDSFSVSVHDSSTWTILVLGTHLRRPSTTAAGVI